MPLLDPRTLLDGSSLSPNPEGEPLRIPMPPIAGPIISAPSTPDPISLEYLNSLIGAPPTSTSKINPLTQPVIEGPGFLPVTPSPQVSIQTKGNGGETPVVEGPGFLPATPTPSTQPTGTGRATDPQTYLGGEAAVTGPAARTPVVSPPALRTSDTSVPQGNPVGSTGSDSLTTIPDYVGQYLASGGATTGNLTTGAPVYSTDNQGTLGNTRPAPSFDNLQISPDYFYGPGTLGDGRGSAGQFNTPTTVDSPTPAPTPSTKTSPLEQPVVETSGFLPASQGSSTPANPLSLDQRRTQFLNQAFSGFGYNYGRNLIPDNSLDDTINSILGEQKGQAQTYLDRGKQRGIYNDVGYNAGENKISNLAEGAQSQLSSLGTDVLNKYRTQANTVRDNAYSAISGLSDGQDFSLDPYFGEGNAIKGTEQRNAGGDLRNALGGQNFFDFQGLTNAAGTAQGALNLRDADVATALTAQKERAAKGRGLGSEGAF